MKLEDHLTYILTQHRDATTYLENVWAKLAELEQAGTYPAVPTERWKDERYLYLYFAEAVAMPHLFNDLRLDAKQRLYIGSDEAKIAEARRLIRNSHTREVLSRLAHDLQSWLSRHERTITDLAGQSGRWPTLAKQLGLDLAGNSGASAPTLGPPGAAGDQVTGPR